MNRPDSVWHGQGNRRRHFRVACRIPASFRVPSTDVDGTAEVVNVGLSGARIDFPVELPMPSHVDVTIRPEGGEPITLAAEVAWTVAETENGPYPTGVRFHELDDATCARLEHLVSALTR